jgi:hypothetical protein
MAILKNGSRGEQVAALQRQLKSLGYNLKDDGIFGDTTEQYVKEVQRRFKLKDDGVVGDKTWAVLSAPNTTLQGLTEADYQWAADFLADDVPSVKAVRDVEAPLGGFLPDGRATILYERHVMYRQLFANGINPDPISASNPDIVNKKTGGYLGKAAEYKRLDAAIAIDEKSALESCSWGAYQIMGYHWKLLGFDSVYAFIDKMKSSERGQLECFVRFIKVNPVLLKAIRQDDWVTFAKYYNGSNYRKNFYDEKLEAAFKKYASLK